MDELKPFNSKLVTDTYIGYSEHNASGQPIVRHLWLVLEGESNLSIDGAAPCRRTFQARVMARSSFVCITLLR